MPENRLLEDAKTLVRKCLSDFGQTLDEETVLKVAKKVVKALPKSVRDAALYER